MHAFDVHYRLPSPESRSSLPTSCWLSAASASFILCDALPRFSGFICEAAGFHPICVEWRGQRIGIVGQLYQD